MKLKLCIRCHHLNRSRTLETCSTCRKYMKPVSAKFREKRGKMVSSFYESDLEFIAQLFPSSQPLQAIIPESLYQRFKKIGIRFDNSNS